MSQAWHAVLTRIGATSRVDLEIIEHAYPASLDELWEREDLGCVFMCGYPWAMRRDQGLQSTPAARLARNMNSASSSNRPTCW